MDEHVQTRLALVAAVIGTFLGVPEAAHALKGIALTLPVIVKDPANLHGYRFSGWIQPESLIWTQVRVYFSAGFGHWWVNSSFPNKSLSIYSITPVLRCYFLTQGPVKPFADLGVGPSWMTRTRFADRNLGMHFAFQDEVGAGLTLGEKETVSIILAAMHYSNASFSNMNAGITVPLILTIALNLD